ncbi:restriction endonuclease subunit S [Ochrobactrum sp. C6C9]|uniref:restriction endonuclease subunit S n=1 Tax=Ochrobactrum sp. C6C9 TaxID=2736662 RepID=UPI00352FF808|nr:restriction endonuclease subunit S [Ochrobactrum sp. C6C9]
MIPDLYPVGNVIEVQPRKHKFKTNEYRATGSVPIIDQSTDFIAGFTDETDRAYDGELPVIIFGDHTCCLKFIDFRFAVGADGTQLLRPVEGLDARYLYYALHAVDLKQFGYQRHFKLLKDCEVRVPCLETQRRIASILGAYDDLIEVNRRRIAVLEEMARGLFEEWFVRFRFPGHEAVSILDTPDGPLPEGWTWGAAADLITFDPRTLIPRDGLKPFISMGHLDTTTSLIAPPEERDGNSGAKFRNGDTLFARITPCLENGKTGLVRGLPGQDGIGFGSTEFIVMRGETAGPAFTYCLARQPSFRDNARNSMSGATGRQRARTESLASLAMPVPALDLLRRFDAVVWPMLELVGFLGTANVKLGASRDLLLPRLISGQLSVAEVERQLEEAA